MHAHTCTLNHAPFYLPSSLVLCSGFLYYTALSVWLWFSEHGDSLSLKISFVTQHFTVPGTWNVLKRQCQIQVSFKQKDIQHLETDKVIFQIHVLILTLMTGVQYSRGLKAPLFRERVEQKMISRIYLTLRLSRCILNDRKYVGMDGMWCGSSWRDSIIFCHSYTLLSWFGSLRLSVSMSLPHSIQNKLVSIHSMLT